MALGKIISIEQRPGSPTQFPGLPNLLLHVRINDPRPNVIGREVPCVPGNGFYHYCKAESVDPRTLLKIGAEVNVEQCLKDPATQTFHIITHVNEIPSNDVANVDDSKG